VTKFTIIYIISIIATNYYFYGNTVPVNKIKTWKKEGPNYILARVVNIKR
jgi:hypothetical protein